MGTALLQVYQSDHSTRKMNKKAIAAFISGTVILALALGLGIGLSVNNEDSSDETCRESKHGKCYKNGAVATDDERCSVVGANLLRKGGSAVDAAIGTLVCQGVCNNYHSGIGGGAFMVIYDKTKDDRVRFLDCREKAPLAATKDMMQGDPLKAQHGPLAIGVPGEVKCMAEAHDRYGKLPWAELFEESIRMAREGYEIYSYMADAMDEKTEWLKKPEYNWEVYLDENGEVKKEGDFITDEKLAQTLEAIAKDKDSFYTGELSKLILQDLEEVGSIIVEDDLKLYGANITEPLHSEFDGKDWYFSRAQSSGPILQLMLNMLEEYNLKPEEHLTDETFHLIIETLKHGYSVRSGLADPSFYPEEMRDLERRCTDPDFISQLRANVTEKTHDIDYYNPLYYKMAEDHGTLHVSTVDENRQMVSVTSTVNLFFGSKIKGKRTGIVFNDEMDDFSSPEFENDFDVPPSEINFIEPQKRMVSSMAPTIAVDKATGDPIMAIGGSGGTKITSGILQVILNKFKFGMTNTDAVMFNRIHHQLSPNQLRYQSGDKNDEGWRKLIEDLHEKRGHELGPDIGNATPVIQSIYILPDGTIEAVSDYRHKGIPDGH